MEEMGLQVSLKQSEQRAQGTRHPSARKPEPLFEKNRHSLKSWNGVMNCPLLIRAGPCFHMLLRNPLGSLSPSLAIAE